MNPFRHARYGNSFGRMPSEIPGDYPAGRASEVTSRQATPEELARVRALPKPEAAGMVIVRDRRGRIVDARIERGRDGA